MWFKPGYVVSFVDAGQERSGWIERIDQSFETRTTVAYVDEDRYVPGVPLWSCVRRATCGSAELKPIRSRLEIRRVRFQKGRVASALRQQASKDARRYTHK